MRALVQRVLRAHVRFPEGAHPARRYLPPGASVPPAARSIGRGVVIFLGVGAADEPPAARRLAEKCAGLRIFSNDSGKFDRSLKDVGGEALVVSQFTLYGDCRKGRRPDFAGAMEPERARPLYESFVQALRVLEVPVQTGEFGARMEVELVNDGPVTLWLETDSRS
ncbi:MAG: D-tyrosyl-tRNA(Tyr) deacylase [Elusimicrobia bacterium]|nr:D-tyrosyl-tRNA(Tyr) deacylase [Elusimicrobiota bacterium]